MAVLKYKLHLGGEKAKIYLKKVENTLKLNGDDEIKNPHFLNLIENKKENIPEKLFV